MEKESANGFKIFLIFVSGMVIFIILTIVVHDSYMISKGFQRQENYSGLKLVTILIIIVAVVYLGKTDVIQNETVATLLGSIAGYVLGN